jgi:fluoride exporter
LKRSLLNVFSHSIILATNSVINVNNDWGQIMGAGGFLAVGLGAALGAWSRWGLNVALNSMHSSLPLGTLVANLAGGYLMGLVMGLFAVGNTLTPELRLFISTGFLGGLTTFSTFSGEAVHLLARGEYGWASTHILGHVIGSLVMTGLGVLTVQLLRN